MRRAVVLVLLASAAACGSDGPAASVFDPRAHFDPLGARAPAPTAAASSRDAGAPDARDEAGPSPVLERPECSPRAPFRCVDGDGHAHCSTRPCIPDCSRIGCVGGRECKRCATGEYECVAPGSSC